MKHAVNIAVRVLEQLRQDKRFFILMLIAPFIVMYFLKIFMDTLSAGFPVERYVVPIGAFLVFFFAFLLCMLVLVRERITGTLERMFINGTTRIDIMSGYALGYLVIATLVAILVLTLLILMFGLNYTIYQLIGLFGVMWILSVVSIFMGVFISTFAKTESQVIPFIPLLTVPSIFLSGLLVETKELPLWAQWVAKSLPLSYANKAISQIISKSPDWSIVFTQIGWLALFVVVLLLLSSLTFKEVQD